MSYSGSVLVYPWASDRSLVPYIAGGAGALTILERRGITEKNFTTPLVTNIGGGVKYFWGRFGLRGDYRFLWADGDSNNQSFFARDGSRYGHRVSGGIILNLLR